jgi:PLD-like domain
VLVDPKANASYPNNATIIQLLKDGGIPIRRIASSWLHWKFMLFAGQNVVQFGSANYSPHAFVPLTPLADFIDETIFFSDDPSIVNSFKTRFDDAWVSTSRFANYANVSGPLTRAYPVYPMNSGLNFPPFQDFGARSVARYNAETAGIDVAMFRFGDRRLADAIIAAHRRGVPVRVYMEQGQYRDPKRPLSAYDVDRLYVAGLKIRQRNHRGWMHEKLTLLRGQRMAIFGTQNWTNTPGQYETNYFTTKSWIYQWLSDRFLRHWNSSTESKPFAPLPPTIPQNRSPSSGAQLTSPSQATLRWHAGSWGYKYDIYFGTSSSPPLLARDVVLGHSATTTDYKAYTVTGLSPNRTYYWRIVSKTFANMAKGGAVWSFRTGA